MKLCGLRLENFRAYRWLDLRFPEPSPGRPVYLLGGENGAGKTSLLSALVFGLYGHRAKGIAYQVGRREPDSVYRAMLADLFNQPAARAGADQMSVQVDVEAFGNIYSVLRQWWFEDGVLADEDVRLRVDGAPLSRSQHDLRSLQGRTAAVDELLDILLPPNAARFFFFDGEQISSIAERDLDRSVIAGLDDLLGLDHVKRTVALLRKLERRERDGQPQDNAQGRVRAAQSRLEHAEAVQADEERRFAELRQRLEELEIEHQADRAELRALFDGRIVDGTESLKARFDGLTAAVEARTKGINRLLADHAGLLTEPGLLVAIDREAEEASAWHRDAEASRRLDHTRKRVRRRLSAVLRDEGLPRPALRRALAAIDEGFRHAGDPGERPALAELEANHVDRLCQQALSERAGRAITQLRKLLLERLCLRRELHVVRRDLRKFEQSGRPQVLLDRLGDSARRLAELRAEISRRHEAVQRAEDEVKQASEAVHRVEDELSRARLGVARIAVARRARLALESFAREVRATRTHALAREVTERLATLLHRSEAIAEVDIDPDTCSVWLLDGSGAEIAVPSAGEKELFALALVHGLARLSRRQAPLVIDTPLGRLDRAHRVAVVERFMPTAGEQVFVLTTDSEVDEELYSRLRPHITWQATLRPGRSGVELDEGQYFGEVIRR